MRRDGDEVARVRDALRGAGPLREVRMFGGTAFMVNGNMAVAVSHRGLLVRVGPDEYERALKEPGARAMQMRNRTMTGYIVVDPLPGEARTVRFWVQKALRHNRMLPPKKDTPMGAGAAKTGQGARRRARS
jgi:TfoX/Sxy family transcriptional regulator of competence genes